MMLCRCLFLCQCFNESNFFLFVGGAVLAEYFVKPLGRFGTVGDGFIPGVFCVGFAFHQAPVNGTYALFLQKGHDVAEEAVVPAGHVFRTDHGSVVLFQSVNSLLVIDFIAVIVVGDDVGISQLKFVEIRQSVVPDTGRYRLRRVDFPCPLEHILQEGQ